MSKKVLITGAAGFVGARFVESCLAKKWTPVSVDELSHFNNRPEHSRIEFGEKIAPEAVFAWLDKNKVDAMVHLGAITDTTCLDEKLLREKNLEYSQKIWAHATRAHIPLVYASSAATYGDGALGYDDREELTSQLKPLNPYGESKRLFDLWALEEEKKKVTPPSWCGFKFFNVYGFGERHKGKMASVVLHAFDQIKKQGAVKLFKSYRPDFADGKQMRDFIYVGDVVEVMWFALQKPIARGIYNLGTGRAHSFLDLVRPIFKTLNLAEKIEFIEMPPGLSERYQYFTEAKMERLKSQGWNLPFTSLENGVSAYTRKLASV